MHEFDYKLQINFAGNNNFGRFNSKTCYTRIILSKISITTPVGVYKQINLGVSIRGKQPRDIKWDI